MRVLNTRVIDRSRPLSGIDCRVRQRGIERNGQRCRSTSGTVRGEPCPGVFTAKLALSLEETARFRTVHWIT